MIGVTTRLEVTQDVTTTYNWLVDAEAALKFIQGVKNYELLDGTWSHEGDRRLITLDTDATLIETIKTIKHSKHFGYELTEFSGMSRLGKIFLIRGASQCWFRESIDGGTCVTWRFSYEPRNLLISPFLWLFMKTAYRANMKTAMRKMKRFSEEHANNL